MSSRKLNGRMSASPSPFLPRIKVLENEDFLRRHIAQIMPLVLSPIPMLDRRRPKALAWPSFLPRKIAVVRVRDGS